jgi:hypothetical protein
MSSKFRDIPGIRSFLINVSKSMNMKHLALACMFGVLLASALYAQNVDRAAQLPDAPGRDTVKKLCAGAIRRN